MRKEIWRIHLLRILATVNVVMLHVVAERVSSYDSSSEWIISNVISSATRWSVPVFFMISGTLFLYRGYTKIPYSNILRIARAYFFWSFCYAFINYIDNYYNSDLKNLLYEFLAGHYHLWYCYSIIGVYLCIPILSSIASNKMCLRYVMLIGGGISFILPSVVVLFNLFGIYGISDLLNSLNHNLGIFLTYGYAWYFWAGYYLFSEQIKSIYKRILYMLGVIAYIFTSLCTIYFSRIYNTSKLELYDNLQCNVMLMAIGIFILFCSIDDEWIDKNISVYVKNMIIILSKSSFGVYLIHPLIMERLALNMGIGIESFHFGFTINVFLYWGIIVITAYGLSVLINKIPVVNKYIV